MEARAIFIVLMASTWLVVCVTVISKGRNSVPQEKLMTWRKPRGSSMNDSLTERRSSGTPGRYSWHMASRDPTCRGSRVVLWDLPSFSLDPSAIRDSTGGVGSSSSAICDLIDDIFLDAQVGSCGGFVVGTRAWVLDATWRARLGLMVFWVELGREEEELAEWQKGREFIPLEGGATEPGIASPRLAKFPHLSSSLSLVEMRWIVTRPTFWPVRRVCCVVVSSRVVRMKKQLRSDSKPWKVRGSERSTLSK